MSELMQWFAMDGHGTYVWSAYFITFVVLVLNAVLTRRQFNLSLKRALRQKRGAGGR